MLTDQQKAQIVEAMQDVIGDIRSLVIDRIGDRDLIDRLGLPDGTDADFTDSEGLIIAFLAGEITKMSQVLGRTK